VSCMHSFLVLLCLIVVLYCFILADCATSSILTLSLHDALPISITVDGDGARGQTTVYSADDTEELVVLEADVRCCPVRVTARRAGGTPAPAAARRRGRVATGRGAARPARACCAPCSVARTHLPPPRPRHPRR